MLIPLPIGGKSQWIVAGALSWKKVAVRSEKFFNLLTKLTNHQSGGNSS